jgi:hypothetical protein
VTDEDRVSVAGEVSNLLMARLHASFSERSVKSEVSTPVLAGGGGFRRRWMAKGCSSGCRSPARANSSSRSWRATRPSRSRRRAREAARGRSATAAAEAPPLRGRPQATAV